MVKINKIKDNNLPELVLVKPQEKDFLLYSNILDSGYSSDYLSEIIDTFKPIYKNNNIYILDEKTGKKELSEQALLLKNGKSIKKYDKAEFLALFLASRKNLSIYVDSMSDEIKQLWKLVYQKGFVSYKEADSILGFNSVVNTGYFSSSFTLHHKLVFLKPVRGKSGYLNRYDLYDYTTFITKAPIIHNLFYPFFSESSDNKFNKKWSPDSEEKLRIFKGEVSLIKELQLMFSLQKQKTLYIGDSKKMSLSLVKKAAQQIRTEEFFPETKEAELSRLRSVLLFNTFTSYIEDKGYNQDKQSPEIIKEVITNVYYKNNMLSALLLPHIGGIKQACIVDSYMDSLIIEILDFFDKQEEDRWFDVKELIDHVSAETEGRGLQVFNIYGLERQHLVNKRNSRVIGLDGVFENLGQPFVKAAVLMLCSLGLLDVAYRDYSPTDVSYVDWVKYFRITNLGKYVFEKTDKYEPETVIEDKKYFELDPDRLIVKSIDEYNPYEKLLLDISEPIGNGRYKISCASFLRSSKDMDDISGKIDFFKRFISDDWTTTWNTFFNSLMMKCVPLKSIPSDNYLIYTIEPDNKELIQLLISDKVLKDNVIKAEGYMLLISKSNKKKVFDRMKELGYMM